MVASGNFSTLNPLSAGTDINDGTMSEGNLKYAFSGADAFRNTMAMTHKTYCEVYINSVGGYGGTIGLCSQQNDRSYHDTICFQINYQSGRIYHYKGSSEQNAGSNNAGSTVSAGQVVMMAYDPATYKWWVGINGTWNGSQDPANGNNPCFTGSATMFEDMSGVFWGGWKGDSNGLTCHWNFGQDSTFGGTISAGSGVDDNGFGNFKYSPPSGFLSLSSANAVISDDIDPAQTNNNFPQKQMGVYTYTGNSGTAVTVSTDFQADLIWIKSRDSTDNHYLQDSSRGFGNSKSLSSNATGSEGYQGGAPSTSGAQNVGTSSFQAYGADWSKGTDDMIAWCFKCNGGTTTSDSSADITVTRQSNTEGGFAILTYTGNGSDNQTIAHGLGVKPSFIIIKNRNTSNGWSVWTQYLGDNSKWIQLDVDQAQQSDTNQFYNSGMTTSTIGVRSGASVNGNGNSLVAYVWADVAGMQVFSSYIGNGSTDGTMVITGFRVRLLVIKRASSSGGWRVYDSERHTINPNDAIVRWNENGAEDTANQPIDFLSNGFKIRSSNQYVNQDGGNFIFMAWGDVSSKYSNTF